MPACARGKAGCLAPRGCWMGRTPVLVVVSLGRSYAAAISGAVRTAAQQQQLCIAAAASENCGCFALVRRSIIRRNRVFETGTDNNSA